MGWDDRKVTPNGVIPELNLKIKVGNRQMRDLGRSRGTLENKARSLRKIGTFGEFNLWFAKYSDKKS